MSKLLVTGGCGFIGSNVMDRLLGRGEHHRLEASQLLEGHDAPAPVAVPATDGQRVIEHVQDSPELGHAHRNPPTSER